MNITYCRQVRHKRDTSAGKGLGRNQTKSLLIAISRYYRRHYSNRSLIK